MTGSDPNNDDTIAKNPIAAPSIPPVDADMKKKKKKTSGAFGIFRAALLMLRKRSNGPHKSASENKDLATQDTTFLANNINNNASWTKLVGSVRPLHLQQATQLPPPAAAEEEEEMEAASPAGSSSRGGMSQYASASSLADLDESSDEEDPDEVFDALTGDEMIDAKAEEFIAQFYKQIQLVSTFKIQNWENQ